MATTTYHVAVSARLRVTRHGADEVFVAVDVRGHDLGYCVARKAGDGASWSLVSHYGDLWFGDLWDAACDAISEAFGVLMKPSQTEEKVIG